MAKRVPRPTKHPILMIQNDKLRQLMGTLWTSPEHKGVFQLRRKPTTRQEPNKDVFYLLSKLDTHTTISFSETNPYSTLTSEWTQVAK